MNFCTCAAVIDPGTPHHHYRQTDTYGTAPELSADEQATVDRFEQAEEPEEIRVERVAAEHLAVLADLVDAVGRGDHVLAPAYRRAREYVRSLGVVR